VVIRWLLAWTFGRPGDRPPALPALMGRGNAPLLLFKAQRGQDRTYGHEEGLQPSCTVYFYCTIGFTPRVSAAPPAETMHHHALTIARGGGEYTATFEQLLKLTLARPSSKPYTPTQEDQKARGFAFWSKV
jgi:hypothetical protein